MTMTFNPSRLAQVFGPTPTATIAGGPAPALSTIAAPPPPPMPIGSFGAPAAPPPPPLPAPPTPITPMSNPMAGVSFASGPAPQPPPPTMANPFANTTIAGGPAPTPAPTTTTGAPFGLGPGFGVPGMATAGANVINNAIVAPQPTATPAAWGASHFAPMQAPNMGQAPPWARPPGLVPRYGYQPGMAPPAPYQPGTPYGWSRPPTVSPIVGGGAGSTLAGTTFSSGPRIGALPPGAVAPMPAVAGPTAGSGSASPLGGTTFASGPRIGALSDRRAKTNITRIGSIFGGRK